MPSDPRFFEVDYLQQQIIDVTNVQIAQASIRSGQSNPQPFVAGRRMDAYDLPAAELAVFLEKLQERQEDLLHTDADQYIPDPGIDVLRDLVGAISRTDEHTDEGWEAAFAQTVFAGFIEGLELNLD